jgi:medium-chain acyl-[acyl-carrier-protein] hydrolase
MDEQAPAGLRKWFPSIRRRDSARFQLFCFPFAGGGASAYRLWREQLPAWIEPWAVEYPGHESRFREPAMENAADLAAAIAEQIDSAADRPFALFGHSMGALLAFETARLLRRRHGPQPVKLFVSGHGAPQLKPFLPPMRDLPEARFRDELRKYGGTPEEVLADDDFMQFLSPLLRRDMGVCETYVHADEPRLRVPIAAFGGDEDPTVPWNRLLRWSELTEAAFIAHFMRGKHFFIRDASALVCRSIAESLEKLSEDWRVSPPGAREAHLWTVRVDLTGSEALRLRWLLSADERKAADSFVQAADRARYMTARVALRDLLGRYRDAPPETLRFGYSDNGKPSCEALRPLEFNVSHSGEMALIAFTWGCPVGVDVEHIRSGLDFAGVGRDVFTATELDQLAHACPAQRVEAFFDLWVRKEAFLKRSGQGFSGEPHNTHVGLGPLFLSGRQNVRPASWQGSMQSFSLSRDYAGAIAAETPLDRTSVRRWPVDDPVSHPDGISQLCDCP